MAYTKRLILGFTSALAATLAVAATSPSPVAAQTAQTAVVPFKIQVPEATLRDLKTRLTQTRFPNEIIGTNWDYGADLSYVKALVT